MSQFGMQMPGGMQRRSAMPNIYTGLLFLACVAMAAACVMMYLNGSKVGPEGNAFKLLDERPPSGGYRLGGR